MKKLHEQFAHIKEVSAHNLRFTRHLIIDPVTDLPCSNIVASLQKCVPLHSLTLYIANVSLTQLLIDYMDMFLSGVSTLTLRFIENEKYDPVHCFLTPFDQFTETLRLDEAQFDFFERFPNRRSL